MSKIQHKLKVKEIADRDLSIMTENTLLEIKTEVKQADRNQAKITENCLAAVSNSSLLFHNLDRKFETFETILGEKTAPTKVKATQTEQTNNGLHRNKY